MALEVDGSKNRQACLSTHQSTYKMKHSETSNLLMAVDMPDAGKVKNATIIQCTSTFVEVTQTGRRDMQVVKYLEAHHNIFENTAHAAASLEDIINHCQISESELRDLLAQKAHEYQLM